MIVMLDVQLINMCNRKCWFCPPQSLNKPNRMEVMSDDNIENLTKLIKDGIKNKLIHESVEIALNRYSEPTLNIDLILKVADKIKNVAPNARLSLQTNGYKLDSLMLKRITDKIKIVKVNYYEQIDFDIMIDKVNTLFSFDGIFISNVIDAVNIENEFKLKISYNNSTIDFIANKGKYLVDKKILRNRGSSVYISTNDLKKEDNKCEMLGKVLGIDYNGNIMPCCHAHSSNTVHTDLIIGKLKENLRDTLSKLSLYDNSNVLECCVNCDGYKLNDVVSTDEFKI